MSNISVVVIGGGFAGLATATALAEAGVRVTLLEKRSRLGGRASSFRDAATGDTIDNGQHLFMGCYTETIAFLRRIGTLDRIASQPNLHVTFLEPGRSPDVLHCLLLPAPWHLASGLAGLRGLTWGEKWAARRVADAVRDGAVAANGATVAEWLRHLGQSGRIAERFWNVIALAALNDEPSRSSASLFAAVLSQAFFASSAGSRLGVSRVGLSELYTDAAVRFVESRGGVVRTGVGVSGIAVDGGRVQRVHLSNGETLQASTYTSAVPWKELSQMLPPTLVAGDPWFGRLRQLRSSPIISINLWFDRPVTTVEFAALLKTQTQWFFNKQQLFAQSGTPASYLSLVISGAHALIERPSEELTAMAVEELRQLVPASGAAHLVHAHVIKERHATLSPAVDVTRHRLEQETPIPNLLLAGDWTASALPATIESAVASGHRCAALARQRLSQA